MAVSHDAFLKRLTSEMLKLAEDTVRPHIPVRLGHLRRSIKRQILGLGVGRLHTDEEWARLVHDGRGAIDQRGKKRPLIWYKNPRKDPRLFQGKSPTKGRPRRLTKDEFKKARKKNLLIIAQKVKKQDPQPFFSNEPGGGMFGYPQKAGALAAKRFGEHVVRFMGKDLNVKETLEF